MPHAIVLQPNGKYAIWSSIVDNLLALDMTREEAITEEMTNDHGGYPGGPEALRHDIEEEFKHIEKSGTAEFWSPDWNKVIRWLEHSKDNNCPETLKTIDELGLPRRMKRTISPLKASRYWMYYWINRCENAEMELRHIRLRQQNAQRGGR